MSRRIALVCTMLCTLLFGGTITAAQQHAAVQPNGVFGLPAQKAAIIFAGEVVRVTPQPATARHPLATVKITFRVLDSARGVSRRGLFTLEEWAALWNAGDRYRVGEHVLLFLHGKSSLGLSSPVGGQAGRLAIDAHGDVLAPVSSPVRVEPANGEVASASPLHYTELLRQLRQARTAR